MNWKRQYNNPQFINKRYMIRVSSIANNNDSFYLCLAENDAFKRLPFGLLILSFERTSRTSPVAEGAGRFFGRNLKWDWGGSFSPLTGEV